MSATQPARSLVDAVIIVEEAGEPTKRVPLADLLTIGRHASNNIQLLEASSSRHHAVVYRASKELFRMMDLRSTNGTHVGGKKVEEALLRLGDQVRIGKAILTFSAATPQDRHQAVIRTIAAGPARGPSVTSLHDLEAYLSLQGLEGPVKQKILHLAMSVGSAPFADEQTDDQWTAFGSPQEIELDSDEETQPFELQVDLEILDS
ncbi:MAG: FHA domain-containing protein [Deltaproteobacteria bacterium]|nr:FHA domain-containing protein [Deltaproteobacteria bacterium]